jgi:hypothetical protein
MLSADIRDWQVTVTDLESINAAQAAAAQTAEAEELVSAVREYTYDKGMCGGFNFDLTWADAATLVNNHLKGRQTMNVQHLENVVGHLGAALRQQAESDDKIIMSHIQEAYDAAKKALVVAEGRDHTHVAGTTVGKDIDECAVCGHDLRHPVHARKRE